ncbi:MAG TPA: DUF2254 family protein [Legionella sp.]|nr:DUF2254 family protein [Legionella sp.]
MNFLSAKFLNIIARLHASYWYIPLVMAIGSFLLSIITVYLDQKFVPDWLVSMGWFQTSKPDRASDLLSTIATSMITVAGVIFSMTILAASFAASQIGPRLLSNFMRDRANQITLGTFIATFLYSLFILLALFNLSETGAANNAEPFLPQISLLVAIILTLFSVGVLIFFIHHIPQSIYMPNVIAHIGEEINSKIDRLFPFGIGEGGDPVTPELYLNKIQHTVGSAQYGYIRILDGAFLMKLPLNTISL